jgi:hypothetical protein
LFTTNGKLLTTFTNPTPAANDFFGSSLAAVGADKVLIGAPWDNTGGDNAGSVYLFNTNGTLLTTVNHPSPAAHNFFGWSIAALGSDFLIIGAPNDDTGAMDAGTVYLFSLAPVPPPSLTIRLTASNTVSVSWPSLVSGFALQQNTNNPMSANWSIVTNPVLDDHITKSVIVNPATGSRFYRLSQQ